MNLNMNTDFVLDALGQALHARRPKNESGRVHHSDRGSQYLSVRYTECLSETGVDKSIDRQSDSCDSALAGTVTGLYKAEIIHTRCPWKPRQQLESATLVWVPDSTNIGE